MRIPSLDQLARAASATARRFPMVLAAALAAAVTAQLLVEEPGYEELLWRLMYVATLGLPLLFATTLVAERRRWGRERRAAVHAVALAALGLVFVLRPGWTDPVAGYRYLQLSAGFHLLVAFLPFAGAGTTRGLWQYAKSLFLRFLLAVLYSGVLYVGLAVALLAVDNLFGVDLSGDTYARLWLAIAFVFHPWFFLAGVPEDLEALDRRADYPKGLKVFVQYVLVPLVIVYLLILTAYAVRVMVTWEWPSGWIGWLVSSVAVAGILAVLLVHPVRERAENSWVRVYGRWFWPSLVPSLVLLLVAIGQRIGQYGFTEERYFLLVLTLWLAGMTAYYGITRSDEIRRVPQTLCAVLLVTVAGPWSAYAVSRQSQVDRLAGHLSEQSLLEDGRLRRAQRPVPFEARKEISAGFRYLFDVHGGDAVEPWFRGGVAGVDMDRGEPDRGGTDGGPTGERDRAAERTGGTGESDRAARRAGGPDTAKPTGQPGGAGKSRGLPGNAREAVERLGLDYVTRHETRGSAGRFTVTARAEDSVRPLDGYRWLVRDVDRGDSDSLRLDGRLLVLRADSSELVLIEAERAVARLPLGPTVRRALRTHGSDRVPAADLVVTAEAGGLRAALWLNAVRGSENAEGEPTLRGWGGDLLLGPVDPEPATAPGGSGGTSEPGGL